MKADASDAKASPEHVSSLSDDQVRTIRLELDRILKSQAFGASRRCQQFLSYVVEHTLSGKSEELKERSIGIELFHRPPTYQTGDDPVVRVKAGEVRRRLAQYYAEEAVSPNVRIEIPVGSYAAEFHWEQYGAQATAESSHPAVAREHLPRNAPPLPLRVRIWPWVTASLLVALAIVLLLVRDFALRTRPAVPPALQEFWAPVLASPQPVLICLASPVGYRPSLSLYAKGNRAHPGEYATEAQRFNTLLQLDPNTLLRWKQIDPLANFYVAKDDAYVSASLSALFERIHKASQVRAGHDFSYSDLRNSPAVLVGAFDNSWTLQLTSGLRFVFREHNNVGWIADRDLKGRMWRPHFDAYGNVVDKDYAIIARLLDSRTGQLLVAVAGVGQYGTQAAGAFVSRESAMEDGLGTVPRGWQKRNLEMVVTTSVIDGTAGPPKVVASTTW